ncbi:MAG: aminoacyl-tRNA hydrolase [Treponemataceae bacterium]|nr:MAG: aminoacyl-tRNA hydrolase [Treponemataceae bacterium]
MLKLVVCVGNPGAEYAGNRHNVSWQFIDFADSGNETLRLNFVQKTQFRAEIASVSASLIGSAHPIGEKIFFVKPQTFMNLSGESAISVMKFYKITPAETLVVHDELELPFGTIGLKFGGGLGGHNGLRSMEKNTGSRDFFRLRIGIGRPSHPDIAAYVLSDFGGGEKEALPQIFAQAHALLRELFSLDDTDPSHDACKKLLALYAKKTIIEKKDGQHGR